MTFNELDVVVALSDFQADGVISGQVGTIVHIFTHPSEAYLVEFSNENGETIAMVTAMPSQISLADMRKAA